MEQEYSQLKELAPQKEHTSSSNPLLHSSQEQTVQRKQQEEAEEKARKEQEAKQKTQEALERAEKQKQEFLRTQQGTQQPRGGIPPLQPRVMGRGQPIQPQGQGTPVPKETKHFLVAGWDDLTKDDGKK